MKSEYLLSLETRKTLLEERLARLRSQYASAGRNTYKDILDLITKAEFDLEAVNKAIKNAEGGHDA